MTKVTMYQWLEDEGGSKVRGLAIWPYLLRLRKLSLQHLKLMAASPLGVRIAQDSLPFSIQ